MAKNIANRFLDLDENLINFLEFPHTSEKNEVMSGTSTIVGQSKETTNIIDDPLDDFFVQYDKEPSARRGNIINNY